MHVRALLRDSAQRLGFEIKRVSPRRNQVFTVPADGPRRGRALVSYTIQPFLRGSLSTRHTTDWDCMQIIKILTGFGYEVDVISYGNDTFRPRKDYAVFIDTQSNLGRLAPDVGAGCVKILHVVFAHWLYNNTAVYQRFHNLLERRGVALPPKRLYRPNSSIESADCVIAMGNEFTMGTYRYAGKPLNRIPASPLVTLGWPEGKDFASCRRRFVWFGGQGLVHKGLDLVLEAFASMPDHELIVCGPVDDEPDFKQAFRRELYERPNIQTVGWVDVSSEAFAAIMNRCVGLIHPSCSEGVARSVINCMHAGVIPIATRESSVDIDEHSGIILPSASVGEIVASVQAVSARPVEELRAMARSTWEFAQRSYTREAFVEGYRRTLSMILSRAEALVPSPASQASSAR